MGMIDFAKVPFEKAVHLLTKVLPGFAVLYVYNSHTPGAIASILSLAYLGYATKIWILIAISFALGYTLSTFINTAVTVIAGAIGALWAAVAKGRHPYTYQVAPWRDPKWRTAYIGRFGSEAPPNLTLVLPANAIEVLRFSQTAPSVMGDQQQLAEQITLNVNPGLTTAMDAIINDTEWRMCYERIKIKALFDRPLEPIDEIFGRLNSDFALASAVLVVGASFSAQLRVWWLMAPAAGWIAISVLRLCSKVYQITEPWSTLGAQIEMLKSEGK